MTSKAATRNSSGEVINRLAARVPNLIGGSADLAPSNKTEMKGRGDFSAENPTGANLHFGVREHAMAAICNGLKLHGGLRPYCATFFVFSDYMKNAMRMSALMDLQRGVRAHARLHRRGRGRPHPPAHRAPGRPARHPQHDRVPPRGFPRSGRRLVPGSHGRPARLAGAHAPGSAPV